MPMERLIKLIYLVKEESFSKIVSWPKSLNFLQFKNQNNFYYIPNMKSKVALDWFIIDDSNCECEISPSLSYEEVKSLFPSTQIEFFVRAPYNILTCSQCGIEISENYYKSIDIDDYIICNACPVKYFFPQNLIWMPSSSNRTYDTNPEANAEVNQNLNETIKENQQAVSKHIEATGEYKKIVETLQSVTENTTKSIKSATSSLITANETLLKSFENVTQIFYRSSAGLSTPTNHNAKKNADSTLLECTSKSALKSVREAEQTINSAVKTAADDTVKAARKMAVRVEELTSEMAETTKTTSNIATAKKRHSKYIKHNPCDERCEIFCICGTCKVGKLHLNKKNKDYSFIAD